VPRAQRQHLPRAASQEASILHQQDFATGRHPGLFGDRTVGLWRSLEDRLAHHHGMRTDECGQVGSFFSGCDVLLTWCEHR
jgi:hypothetical protein